MTSLAPLPRPASSVVPLEALERFVGADVALAELIELVEAALSRTIGDLKGERRPLRDLCYVLAALGRIEFRRRDGSLEPAIAPDLPTSWPRTATVLRRLELTPAELDADWRRRRTRDRVHARLPHEIVSAFFPPELALVAACVVLWGPGATNDRLEVVLGIEADRPVKIGPRAGERLSLGALETMQSSARKLMHVLCDLAASDYPSPLLDRWRAVPPRVDVETAFEAAAANLDRSAPPLMVVRRTLGNLTRDVERRAQLGVRHHSYRAKRDRALVGVLAGHGGRVSAVLRQRACDYDTQHHFPDGEVGPALQHFPAKTVSRNLGRWKAVDPELAEWVEEHIASAGLDEFPQRPLWFGFFVDEGGRRVPSCEPLTPPGVDRIVHDALYNGGADRGFSPHTLRHLADQLAQAAGADFLEAEPDALRHISPRVFGDALLDHAIESDKLGYLDLKDERGRERWGRRAAIGVWTYLRGERGARKGPDAERIRAARDSRDERRAEVAAVDAAIEQLRASRRAVRADALAGDAITAEEMLRVVLQLSELDDLLDDELGERDRVLEQLRRAEGELQLAKQTLIALPDDVSPVDLEPDAEDTDAELVAEPVRDWLTLAEAAFVFGVSEPTMRRWFRGESPHAEGDPRNPWQPSQVDEVVQRLSPRKQRLIISQLDRTRIAPDVMRAIKELLTRLPA